MGSTAVRTASTTPFAVTEPRNLSGATRILRVTPVSSQTMTPSGASHPNLIVVSNRGPVNFQRDHEGVLRPVRGGGGLVTSLAPAIEGTGAVWLSSLIDSSGEAHTLDTEWDGFTVKHVPFSEDTYHQFYDVIANGMLWFLHHNLFDSARMPRIDRAWWSAWETYCQVNHEFSMRIAKTAPEGAVVAIHDYHLTLIGKELREVRPDLRTVHFHHTPFTGSDTLAMLPTEAARTLLEGLAGHTACGFHSERWASNFAQCCADYLGRVSPTFVSAAAPHVSDLQAVADSKQCAGAVDDLRNIVGDRKLVVRVDRMELSKNVLRGFDAFDDLLEHHPHWRDKVTFVAHLYPSREGLTEYLSYRREVENLVQRINARWSTDSWTPIVLLVGDDFPRSVAAYLSYDVLLVNPVRDGLNLVAKEGAILNTRSGVVVLSREAGSWTELADAAIGINPFDTVETSEALRYALEMDDMEREDRANRLRRAATSRSPQDWLNDQLEVLQAT
jgi:trehalose 6-phosphate synthase